MGHIVAVIMERFEDLLYQKKLYFGITIKGALSSEILPSHKQTVHKMIPTKKSLRTFRDLLYQEVSNITYICKQRLP